MKAVSSPEMLNNFYQTAQHNIIFYLLYVWSPLMITVLQVYHKNSHENKMLQKRVERLVNEKVALEDRILAKLQDQITQDKASKYLNKVLQTLRDKIRDKVSQQN